MPVMLPADLTINPNWFTFKDGLGILKKEHQDDFSTALKARSDAVKAEFYEYRKEKGTKVNLTEEQKAELAEKYDPENMTQEEYDEFINDLCEYGVLRDSDKYYISAKSSNLDLIPLEFTENGVMVTAMSAGSFGRGYYSLSQAGGNVLNWAKFQSTFQTMDEKSGEFIKTPSAIIFGMVENVLTQISQVDKKV